SDALAHDLKTDAGHDVNHYHFNCELDPDTAACYDNSDAIHFPDASRIDGATMKFNCHAFVYDMGQCWIPDPSQIVADNYVMVADGGAKMVGDIAVSRDDAGAITHSARVTAVDGGVVVQVEGKWGQHGTYRSSPTGGDQPYGDN